MLSFSIRRVCLFLFCLPAGAGLPERPESKALVRAILSYPILSYPTNHEQRDLPAFTPTLSVELKVQLCRATVTSTSSSHTPEFAQVFLCVASSGSSHSPLSLPASRKSPMFVKSPCLRREKTPNSERKHPFFANRLANRPSFGFGVPQRIPKGT